MLKNGEYDLSEEKEIGEAEVDASDMDALADFVDFADLEALEGASNEELFGGLGDLADLGDLPEMEESTPSEPVSQDDLSQDASEAVPEPLPNFPDLTEESSLGDDLFAEIAEEEIAPLPELEEASRAEEEIAPLPETGEEPAPAVDLEEAAPLPDLAPDMNLESVDPMPDLVPDMDLESTDPMPDLVPDMDLESADPMPDLVPDMDLESADPLPDLVPDMDLESTDPLPDLVPDMDLESAAAQPEAEIAAADTEAASGGDLPEDAEVDAMLGGLLDNLDQNGALEEAAPAAADAPEEADLLGIDDNPFAMDGTDEVEDLLGDMMVPEEEKKPGLLKRVFGNVVTDEIAQQERLAAQQEEEEAAKRAELEAQEKEEKDAQKAEKQAQKEAQKAERKKQKEARKAEMAARKEEMKEKRAEEEAAELEVVGKLNKVGVSIIVIATIAFLVVEIAGTNAFGYASSKAQALKYFDMGSYTEAYKQALGTGMKEKDEEEYNKIITVMKVQQSLNAYQNYDSIGYYPEALDSLLKGLVRYDSTVDTARQLEVEDDLLSCRNEILTLLQEEFGLSEQDAYEIIALDGDAYNDKVVALGLELVN